MSTSFESELMKLLDEHKDEIIQIRRYLHQHPELSFHGKHTSEFIKNYYKGLDCQVRDCGDGYGIVVDINADNPGKKNQPGALTLMHCQSKRIMIYHLSHKNLA